MADDLVELVWWFFRALFRNPTSPRARVAHWIAVAAVGAALSALTLLYVYNDRRAIFLVLTLMLLVTAGVAEMLAASYERQASRQPDRTDTGRAFPD